MAGGYKIYKTGWYDDVGLWKDSDGVDDGCQGIARQDNAKKTY
jgi:hypothetical protein